MSHQEEMRKAFIADIAANPEDLARRLIFADWLEDNGDPERAEFIRVQMELSQAPEKCLKTLSEDEPPYTGCDDCIRVHQLHARMEKLWYSPARGSGFDDGEPEGFAVTIGEPAEGLVIPQLVFRRGFVEEVYAPLSVLEEHLPRIVQEHPILSVRATDREPQEDREAFCWYREGSYVARETAMIPEEVWLRLENDDDNDIPARCRFCAYRTAEHAHAALSKALLKLARDKVVSPAAPA